MNPPHLRPADAEQYVLGTLRPEAAAALEAHTLTCPPCADLLQREALLEERLREVAQATALEPGVLRPARWSRARVGAALGVMMAAAAAVTLVLLRPERTQPPPPRDGLPVMALPETPVRLVACPDLASQEACATEALARGLLVQYPQGVGEVPRYEGHAGLPPGALDAEGPSPL